jgi:hypothetical protein
MSRTHPITSLKKVLHCSTIQKKFISLLLIALFLTANIIGISSPSLSSQDREVDSSSSAKKAAEVNPIFTAFRRWIKKYIKAKTPEAKAALIPEGIELAKQRLQVLEELIKSDPELSLKMAVPLGLIDKLPNEIKQLLEERVSGKSELHVEVASSFDDVNGVISSNVERKLITSDGSEFKARVYGNRLRSATRKLHAAGIRIGRNVALHQDAIMPEEEEEDGDSSTSMASSRFSNRMSRIRALVHGKLVQFKNNEEVKKAERDLENSWIPSCHSEGTALSQSSSDIELASAWTEGPKTLLYIRVDFSDMPGEPIAESTAKSTVDNAVNKFYMDNSYGKTSVSVTVTPVLRLPETAATYKSSTSKLLTDARAAAKSAGFDTADYNLDLVAFKKLYDGWSGMARVGAKGAWLNGSFGAGVTAHELGHNYGTFHANFWDTTDNTSIGAGKTVEYGNPFDVMGRGGASAHFNAWFKTRLNWLLASDVQTVTQSGVYRIMAHDNPNSHGLRALKIVKDSNINYWVEFRQQFTSNSRTMNGVLINWGYNKNTQSNLIDTTPGSATGNSDASDAALAIGQTFVDEQAGIQIKPLRKVGTSPESIDVEIRIGNAPPPTPTPVPPTPTPTPELTHTIQLGQNWNLISLPIQPTDDDIADVLAPINGMYSVVHAWNGTAYESYYPGNSSSALKKMPAGRGYWVFMKQAGSLQVKGKAAGKNISLGKDWNLVGYNSLKPMPASEALKSTGGKITDVYSYNAAENKYDVVETFQPGDGYWVLASEDVNWTLP